VGAKLIASIGLDHLPVAIAWPLAKFILDIGVTTPAMSLLVLHSRERVARYSMPQKARKAGGPLA
jgi:hypothetical protein